MRRQADVDGVVGHHSTQCRCQDHGANPEESALGEGPDATGRVFCELSAQSCGAGEGFNKPEVAEYCVVAEQDRPPSSESEIQGTTLGSGGAAGNFLDPNLVEILTQQHSSVLLVILYQV